MDYSFFTKFQLDPKSLAERQTTIGGSEINILAGGDPEKINNLWLRKRGELEPDDLSTVWPVLMGHITEELNLEWCELKNNLKIINRQLIIRGKKHPLMRCTLDGSIDKYRGKQAVIDAKYTMGRPMKGEEWSDVIPRLCKHYSPQLHWNAYLLEEKTGKKCPFGLLTIIRAGNEPTLHEIEIDPNYQAELIGLATYFMGCVDMGVPPQDIPVAEAPVPHEDAVPVDMTQTQADPKWRQWAEVWAQTVGAMDACKKAETEIKKLVPKNASLAFGHGIQVKVAKNKSKRIEVLK
tara:strand:- start:397 stop:1275 length:879 start_codon:yes stop_codon:yes gene_type:complete